MWPFKKKESNFPSTPEIIMMAARIRSLNEEDQKIAIENLVANNSSAICKAVLSCPVRSTKDLSRK